MLSRCQSKLIGMTMRYKPKHHVILCILISVVFSVCNVHAAPGNRIQPEDFVYKGAFRLPEVAGDCDWTYSGHAMTYYPNGDVASSDNYPGSLFATGNDAVCQHVSEISIPNPVVHPSQTSFVTQICQISHKFGL